MSKNRQIRVLVLAMLVSACAGTSGTGSTIPLGEGTTTEPPTTVTTMPPTTATTVATTTTVASVTTATSKPDGAEGSGCAPGSTTSLPDGRWYGLVVDSTGGSVDFDLACWYAGQAAIEAAAEDGEEPPPNDYYVRNDNDQIRSLPVSSTAHAAFYPTGDPNGEAYGTFTEWRDMVAERGAFFGVWIEVVGGEVTSLTEQWVP